MPPTLTQRRRQVKQRSAQVERRKAIFRRANGKYDELARLADVTYSMAWKYMNGERKSSALDRAFAFITTKKD